MNDPSRKREIRSKDDPNTQCEQVAKKFYEEIARLFRSEMNFSVDRSKMVKEGDGRCTLDLIFHGKADLKYTLFFWVTGQRIVIQVQSHTIHKQKEVLRRLEGNMAESLSDQIRSVYETIDMDIRRILFTNS